MRAREIKNGGNKASHHVSAVFPIFIYGAGEGIRTSDLLITSQLLYQLSYTGDGAPKERRKIL